MKSPMYLSLIDAQETHKVRHPILRKGRPVASCVFENDLESDTLHLGAFEKDLLVGVLSAYRRSHPDFAHQNSYQIRGVAVLEDHQKKGIGRLLMSSIEEKLLEKNIDFIWLNARVSAVPFYQQLQYTVHGDVFDIPPIGPHFCYFKCLQ